jgi:GT2 family glycosyltransferase
MAWLNSDDMLLPGSLAYVGRYFAEHPEVDVVYGHRVLIDTSDREIGRWVMPAHDDEVLSWADYVPQETLFWRRDVWERAGGTLNEELRFALDWDLLLRLRDAGATIVRLPRFLGAFRIHEEQKSSAQVGTLGRGEMDRLRRRVHGRRVSPEETAAATRSYLRRHLLLDKLQRLRLLRH